MHDESLFSLDFAAAGCNRKPGSLCALPSRQIAAYASSSNVFIVTDGGRRISAAIPVHSATVTAVVLVESPAAVFLVTSSACGHIAVWACAVPQKSEKSPWTNWKCTEHWKAHEMSVVACDAFWKMTSSSLIIVSAGMDSQVRVWMTGEKNEVSCMSECCLMEDSRSHATLPECLAICSNLQGENEALLIAVGGTHQALQLLTTNSQMENLHVDCRVVGHGDWIRGVAFSPVSHSALNEGSRYMATASKDSTVRIWRICERSSNPLTLAEPISDLDAFSDLGPTKELFSLGSSKWEVTAVALLQEHGGAVHSVCFEQTESDTAEIPKIVTSSMDCSIAIWQFSEDDGWQCASRFGLMGSAGAHALGFFGAVFLSHGCSDVLAHNFGGALHCWRASAKDSFGSDFVADCAPGGHNGPVHDLDWDPQGHFFMSCSQDKTTRVFLSSHDPGYELFVQWARPQVHGHAIQTVAFCDDDGMKYVSGAEESMLRMFQAPALFVEPFAFANLEGSSRSGPFTASVPELGLSNKAVYSAKTAENNVTNEHENSTGSVDAVSFFGAGRSASSFPLEEELKQSRLWPETAKLYGHGNPISCVCVCLTRGVVASACFAQKPSDATIRLWDLSTGVEVVQLPGHDLTVTKMRFSEDGTALLSVSRDRSFALYASGEKDKFNYSLVHRQIGAHSRLLHDGAWIFNCDFVVTCGRDKRLRFFSTKYAFENNEDPHEQESAACQEVLCIKYLCGVSSVDALTVDPKGKAYVAVGFEDGAIVVYEVKRTSSCTDVKVEEVARTPRLLQCSARITKLKWRPTPRKFLDSGTDLQLTVASADHSVRVLRLKPRR